MSAESEDGAQRSPSERSEYPEYELSGSDAEDTNDPLSKKPNDDTTDDSSNECEDTTQNVIDWQDYFSGPAPTCQNNKPKDQLLLSEASGKFVKRIRDPDPSSWKQNRRIYLRNAGLPYINLWGQEAPGRKVEPPCTDSCYLSCTKKITEEEREVFHKTFWKLTVEGKHLFIATYVKRVPIKRRRKISETEDHQSRKQSSFRYFFSVGQQKKVKVCKVFFIRTLGVSERKVYYYFKSYNDSQCKGEEKAKQGRKRIEPERIREVREHIASHPTFQLQDCCSTNKKTFLQPGLSVQKMYDFYKFQCENPVSLDIYRRTFKTDFNLEFYFARREKCGRCKKHRRPQTKTKNISTSPHRYALKVESVGRELSKTSFKKTFSADQDEIKVQSAKRERSKPPLQKSFKADQDSVKVESKEVVDGNSFVKLESVEVYDRNSDYQTTYLCYLEQDENM